MKQVKNYGVTLSLVVAAILFAAPGAFANQPGNCAPLGYINVGPPAPYDFIANGRPGYDGCWSETNLTYVTGYDNCNYWRNYWDFGNGGVLSQTMVVPSDLHITSVKVFYILDAIDPHNDGNANAIRVDIYDQTAGNTWIGGDFWSGYYGSVTCAQKIGYAFSNVDLAGHTLQLSFTVRKGYSDVHINVKFIDLLAN